MFKMHIKTPQVKFGYFFKIFLMQFDFCLTLKKRSKIWIFLKAGFEY